MIVELITSISATWNVIKFFNDDYFFAKEKAERKNTHCEFKYVGKTIEKDGERLFELTDPQGKKYILFKQVCENNDRKK